MLSFKGQSVSSAANTPAASEVATVVAHEIERKWIVITPPPLESVPTLHIAQGYLTIAADGHETRVRRAGEKFFLTEKRGEGLVREEKESSISREEFERLWDRTEGRRIEKVRHLISHGTSTIEVDVYCGAHAGLIVAEVEFPSRRASEEFQAPEWFGAEVTDDVRYKNRNLAVRGVPAA